MGAAAASVGDALRAAAQQLRASGSRSPRLDAELLLAASLGVTRAELFRRPERTLTEAESERFDRCLRRREAHEPVAYIRGVRAFRTIELEVTREVLIPRPETESLVEVALETLAAASASDAGASHEPLALDVGTGSGCVALALAAENPFVHVVATDISDDALGVARRNAARLGLEGRVDFAASDLFAGLPAARLFDLIVSNPPYISAAEYAGLEPNVRDYEPRLALVAGSDGLDVYRRLVPAAARRLRRGGTLALEVGVGQAAAVRELIAAAGSYAAARERADLGGIPRVVWARRRGGDG